MKKTCAICAVFGCVVLFSFFFTPVRAEGIGRDVELVMTATHIFQGPPVSEIYYGSFSYDPADVVHFSGTQGLVYLDTPSQFTANIDGIIYDDVIGTAGAVGYIMDEVTLDPVRMTGFVDSSLTSASLNIATDSRLGNIWGTTPEGGNLRGTLEIYDASSNPEDIIQNGRFGRSSCALFSTCTGWLSAGLGNVQTIEIVEETGHYAAQLTTGSEAILSQFIDTPNDPFRITLDYTFADSTGVLDVFLGSTNLGSIYAVASSEFTKISFLVDDPSLLGQTGQALSFHLNGQTGSQILLDNITATTIPVPSAIWLFSSGLLGLFGITRRKKYS